MIVKTVASAKLFLLAMVAAVTIVLLGWAGLSRIRQANSATHTVLADRLVPIKDLTEIKSLYAVSILNTLTKASENLVLKNEALQIIGDADRKITIHWGHYKNTYLTPEESEKVKRTEAAMQLADKQALLFIQHPSPNTFQISQQNINAVISLLNDLIELQVSVAKSVEGESNSFYAGTQQQFMITVIGALLFILLLSYFIINDNRVIASRLRESGQMLADSQKRLQTLIYNAGDAILFVNEELRITDANNQASILTGYSREELMQLTIPEIILETQLEHVHEVTATLEYQSMSLHERSILSKSGKIIETEVNVSRIEGVGFVSIIREIGERKKAENELKESEEKYRYLFQNNPTYIIIWDLETLTVLEVNEPVIGKYGYPREEWKGMPVFRYRPAADHDRIRQFAEDMLTTDRAVQKKVWTHLDKNGNELQMEISSHRIMYNNRKAVLSLGTDITERTRAEQLLRQSEEKQRVLLENIGDGVALLDKNMVLAYHSAQAEKISGYMAEEVIGSPLEKILFADDVPLILEHFRVSLATPGANIPIQFRLIHKTGDIIWMEGNAVNLLDNPSVQAIVINYRNITGRRLLEEKQLLLTSIVNSSDDAIISKKMDGTITSWNRGAERILGYSPAEIIGKNIKLLLPPSRLAEEETIISHVSQGKHIDHYETVRVRKDGSNINVSLTISPIYDSSGTIIGASKVLRDITSQKLAEELIRQSEANYRQLFDLSPAPMLVIDEASHKIIQVNQACIKVYGYTEDELLSMTEADLLWKDDGNASTVSTFRNPSAIFHTKKSGDIIEVALSSIPVVLNGKNRILIIAIDVTEKNLYEQKLTQAAIKAQEQERYEMGGELHDNICQILAGATIYIDLLGKSLPGASQKYYESARKNIVYATEEIRNLSHRLAPAFFKGDSLEDAFNQLVESFNLYSTHKVTINCPGLTEMDEISHDLKIHLYRILQEQLRNIIKHAKASEIHISVTNYKDKLQLDIRDNGVGLDVNRIKGGIGLANMNRRVQIFSGTLKIFSVPGKGCHIHVEMPIKMQTSSLP